MGTNRKENRQINFRVSDLEFERLEQMAKDVGMSVPTFCKKKAQGAKMKPPIVNKEGAIEIARQLRAIGNNVNQLAKRANQVPNEIPNQVRNQVPSEVLKEIQRELQRIWQQFN